MTATAATLPRAAALAAAATAPAGDAAFYARREADGTMTIHAMVEGVHCGGCVAKIERALGRHPAVVSARVNLSTRRLALRWIGAAELAETLAAKVNGLGFKLVPPTSIRCDQFAFQGTALPYFKFPQHPDG